MPGGERQPAKVSVGAPEGGVKALTTLTLTCGGLVNRSAAQPCVRAIACASPDVLVFDRPPTPTALDGRALSSAFSSVWWLPDRERRSGPGRSSLGILELLRRLRGGLTPGEACPRRRQSRARGKSTPCPGDPRLPGRLPASDQRVRGHFSPRNAAPTPSP